MSDVETLGLFQGNISGIPVTLKISNLAHLDVAAYVIPQFPDRPSLGGVNLSFGKEWGTPGNPFDVAGPYEIHRKLYRAEHGQSLELGWTILCPTINEKTLMYAITAGASEFEAWDIVQSGVDPYVWANIGLS